MEKSILKEYLLKERRLYLGSPKTGTALRRSLHKRYLIWRYLYYFRLCQYSQTVRKDPAADRFSRIAAKYTFRYYNRKRNLYGSLAGVEIGLDSHIGCCPDIWHGGVIVNGTLGDYCVLHGNNVIGNKGIGRERETPVIGSHADIGAGAVVIGGVAIADRCKIGAGAVVTKSCDAPDSVLAGVPAKIITKESPKGTEV